MIRSDRPVANPVVVLREEFDDWAILFNPDTADAAGTNPVGVAVWKEMDGKRSVEDIAAVIQQRFEGTPESLVQEVVNFVDTLEEFGFVGQEMERSLVHA